MRIINAGFEILTTTPAIEQLKHIERIGRVCYKSEDKISEDGESAKKFVAMLINRGHEAMIEHSMLSIKFVNDRGVSHEEVRHRLASFAQESTRYCNYSNDKFGNGVTYIDIMPGIMNDISMQKQVQQGKLTAEAIHAIYEEWLEAGRDAERHYLRLIEFGATPNIARSVLNNSTKTEITLTANFREWRNFFKLRADQPAHPQMRELMVPLLIHLKTVIPVIFDDITPFIIEDYLSLN